MSLTEDQKRNVSEHMDTVSRVAAMEARRFSRVLTLDDALSSASMGACQAVQSFDPSKGASLQTHITRRAKGQILDDMRTRAKQRGYNRHYGTEERVHIPIHDQGNKDNGLENVLGTTDANDVDSLDEAEHMIRQIAPHDERARSLMRMVFIDGMTMKQAGIEIGLSESRVSQVLNHARQVGKAVLANKQTAVTTAA